VDFAVEDFGRVKKWTTTQVSRAKRICYRTIWAESDWLNYANVNVPGSINITPNDGYPSHGGDASSVGLYQQMEKWGWGDTLGSMSPGVATTRFLQHMSDGVPQWATLDEWDVCQRVQHSRFNGTPDPVTGKPYPYAQNYKDRSQQVDGIAADKLYFTNQAVRSTA